MKKAQMKPAEQVPTDQGVDLELAFRMVDLMRGENAGADEFDHAPTAQSAEGGS